MDISRERAYLAAGFVVGHSTKIEDLWEKEILKDAGHALKYLLDDGILNSRMKPELYRHEKTGGVYEVICNATDESTKKIMVVYRNVEDGSRWIRSAEEFNDGRFTRIDV